MDRAGAAPAGVARGDEPAPEPREVRTLGGRAVGGTIGIGHQGRPAGLVLALGHPDDAVLRGQPLGQPPDERLVAGPDGHELRAEADLAVIVEREDEVRCRRVSRDRQLANPALGRPGRGRPDRVGVLEPDPRLDLREESVGRDLAREEASLWRMAGRVEGEVGHGTSSGSGFDDTTPRA